MMRNIKDQRIDIPHYSQLRDNIGIILRKAVAGISVSKHQ